MLTTTHTGVTICLLQEAETFSILSIWAGERRAAGHAPRGIHLSLRSTLSAVATGDRGNVRDVSFFFRRLTLSNEAALYITAGMLSCLVFSHKPSHWRKMTSISVRCLSEKKTYLCTTFLEQHLPVALWCNHFPMWFG